MTAWAKPMTPRDYLERYPLFALLDPHVLATWIESGGEELEFPTGETVFREGTTGGWMYLVLEGNVRVLRKNPRGKDTTVGTLREGDLFGEYALLSPGKNTATCRISSTARLLRLPLQPLTLLLEQLLQGAPQLKKWLRLHALLNYLRGRCFLGFMSGPSALRYLDHFRPVHFRKLRTIQADGINIDRFFYIEQGEAALHVPGEPGPRELGPGDWFGVRALSASSGLPEVVALSDLNCLCLNYHAFQNPDQNPKPRDHASIQSYRSVMESQQFGWIGQRQQSDCGLAALAMLAQFYSKVVTVEQLLQNAILKDKGASLLELKRLADLIGLPCQVAKIDFEQWDYVCLPAIAHQSDGHYVVIFRLAPHRIEVADPATGIVSVSPAAFRQVFSGYILCCRPNTTPR